MSNQGPQDIDRALGKRIKNIRENLHMTQTDLAKLSGVSFQQVQKYETAANRISVSRLFLIAQGLGMRADQLIRNLEES